MTQDAGFVNNGILLITFRDWILLIMGDCVLLMMFLLIMEAAPMVMIAPGVGARFVTFKFIMNQ